MICENQDSINSITSYIKITLLGGKTSLEKHKTIEIEKIHPKAITDRLINNSGH